MDTTNHQKLASFSQSLAIFAVLVVVPILGDLSDLTDHDLTLIKQMENFEKNLNAGKRRFNVLFKQSFTSLIKYAWIHFLIDVAIS